MGDVMTPPETIRCSAGQFLYLVVTPVDATSVPETLGAATPRSPAAMHHASTPSWPATPLHPVAYQPLPSVVGEVRSMRRFVLNVDQSAPPYSAFVPDGQ